MALAAITKYLLYFLAISDLLDPVNTSHSELNVTAQALLLSDYELNGTINRAASEGAKFALILSMLEQNSLHRPHLGKSKKLAYAPKVDSDINHYRSPPLSVNDMYWQTCKHTSQLIQSGQFDSAHLWLAMHPEPLSMHNTPDVIGEEVIANCSINTQNRIQQYTDKVVNVDETELYDILQTLEPISI